MVRSAKNSFIRWFFHRYILRIVGRNFHAVNFNQIETNSDKSILLLANHYSWWDGFLLYYINARLFKRKIHMMVHDQTLQQHLYFKAIGAYPIKKKSKEIFKSLEYTTQLLADPENLVVIFPQGKIYSNFINSVNFEKGIGQVINKAAQSFQLIFAVSFIEHLQHKKASVNVYLKNIGTNCTNLTEVNQAFQEHYQAAKTEQTKTII